MHASNATPLTTEINRTLLPFNFVVLNNALMNDEARNGFAVEANKNHDKKNINKNCDKLTVRAT